VPSRRARVVFSAAAVIGAAGALALAWLPTSTAVSHFVIEDFAYYLTAARHVIAGDGATLDGVNPTNGFHPLWLLLLCGVELIFGSQGQTTFHVALTLAAAGFIATGCLLAGSVRDEGAPWLVAPFAALFFFNYRLMSIPLGGLETGIAGLSVVAVALAVQRWEGTLDLTRAIALGALLGIACLARMDAFLFGGIVLAWLSYRAWRTGRVQQIPFVMAAAVTAFVCLIPWFVFSWRSVHHLLPRSGEAIFLWAVSPWHRPWTESVVMHAARGTLIGPAGNIANLIGIWPFVNTAGAARLTGAAALLAGVTGIGALAWRWRADDRVQRVAWIPVFAACLWAYYTQLDREHVRYLYPAILLLFYFAVVVIAAAARHSVRPDAWARGTNACAAVMLVVLAVSGVTAYRQSFASGYTHRMHGVLYEDVIPWLQTQTPRSAVVGAFNAGMISYFSGRTTVDLDGVMNDRTIEAMKAQRLCDFIEDQHITHLVDNDLAIDYFMARDASCVAGRWRARWREVHRVTWPPDAGRDALDWIVLERVTSVGPPQ
jgi:hypothetical protein